MENGGGISMGGSIPDREHPQSYPQNAISLDGTGESPPPSYKVIQTPSAPPPPVLSLLSLLLLLLTISPYVTKRQTPKISKSVQLLSAFVRHLL
ncbi:hypothetical protein CFAM422_007130 [Trichoderma lentiforme]|uniref:Uncharacterized protein n=1 Tax=Trichoderma lentiforme TaxID=1567552 RepID=A0A9P4XEY3_9HYPO|nr:hypothetical protein CFAM422_007130 [Trichoderma lentiforme]